MLISPLYPPLAPLDGITGEPAMMPPPRLGLNGLSGDPFGITDVLGLVSSWMQTKSQEKIAKKQIGVEQQQLKEQRLEDARGFAQQQAATLAQPSETKRQDQMIGLVLVGGGALVLSAILIMGAVKARKGS